MKTEYRVLQVNILVNSGYRAMVSDFGSARVINQRDSKDGNPTEDRTPPKTNATSESVAVISISTSPSGSKITLSGPILTYRWAARELLAGATPTLASDIWALGLVCLEVGLQK